MARGGARARSGPPPDPNALRRDRKDDKSGWTTLPADGREGDPPEWPLTEPSDRELALWEREWCRPQAVEWERNGQELEVALFVRNLVEAEEPGASKAKRELVKQNMEALGLSLPGLLRNRWRIGGGADVLEFEPRAEVTSAKDRFKVVSG